MRYLTFFLLIAQVIFVLESFSEDFKENSSKSLNWKIIKTKEADKQKNHIEWEIKKGKNSVEIKNRLKKEKLINNM